MSIKNSLKEVFAGVALILGATLTGGGAAATYAASQDDSNMTITAEQAGVLTAAALCVTVYGFRSTAKSFV